MLDVSKAVLEADDYITCKGIAGAALLAVDEVKLAADAAIAVAQEALDLTDKVTNEAITLASAALQGVGELGEAAIKLASVALEEYKLARVAILEAAQKTVDALETTVEWIEYEAACAALTVAKAAGSGALFVAKGGVILAEAAEQTYMKVKAWVVSHFTQFVDITDVTLTSELGKACGGFAFSAHIRGTIGDDNFFSFDVEFSTKEVVEFIKQIFEQ